MEVHLHDELDSREPPLAGGPAPLRDGRHASVGGPPLTAPEGFSPTRAVPSRFLPRPTVLLPSAVLAAVVLSSSAAALAVDVTITSAGPSLVNEPASFKAAVTDATGPVTYLWSFDDAKPDPVTGEIKPQAGGAEITHTFTTAAHHAVNVEVMDGNGDGSSAGIQQLVHHPNTDRRPTTSSSIIYDAGRKRIYSVNQDNDSVTAVDAEKMTKLGELEVYRKPEAIALTPEGKLWVVHQDDWAVAVLDPDKFVIEHGFRLPYASQPVGVVVSPTGDAAYISLMAYGKVIKLDPRTGEITGDAEVGPKPRGLAVSHDGKDLYVTRFISPNDGGEVLKIDTATMKVAPRILLEADATADDIGGLDTDQKARGVPNYLFSIIVSPDGRQAWVPAKKDNIFRGEKRDGLSIGHDNVVRPLVTVVDLLTGKEIHEDRVDLDDRSPPTHVEFSPMGDFGILCLGGSNRIEIRDVYAPAKVFSAIPNVGIFPRASVATPDQRLFVQAANSREILVYDLSLVLGKFDTATPKRIGMITAVDPAHEKLPKDVLLGKQIFHDSSDRRMADEQYVSCGVCHFEGIDDGRVYDFSVRGEGLRNTLSLLGKGTKQGRLNWTGNLDEVQDFEHQIRDLFKGTGFLSNEDLAMGTRNDPLGDKIAGLDPDLDALAAYVSSLDHVNPSPFRNSDGTMTEDGIAGKAVFEKLGCDFCHGGPEFTDSGRGLLHDVGTITAASGTRAGQPLMGFDSPTLLGVWETAPYLHDGSAATLRDVLTKEGRNSNDLHGYVSSLSSKEVDQLVAYLMQIDDERPVHPLPFDPPTANGSGGSGGGGTSPGGAGGKGAGACEVASGSRGGEEGAGAAVGLALAALVIGRRPRRARARRPAAEGTRSDVS